MNTWIAGPRLEATSASSEFLDDVRAGLGVRGQKTLPPKYLYDDLGSFLFDAITRLPEYAVWRAERALLVDNAAAIAATCPVGLVVELGCGSAEKTRPVLEALCAKREITYRPIEISKSALDIATRAYADMPSLTVSGIATDYLAGAAKALRMREPGVPAMVMFLGSSLGNFEALASFRFLQSLRRLMRPGDTLLLGSDLDKPEARLLAAYDDSLGVTAAFNLNLLVRMNRELDARFRLQNFRHRVRYDRTRHTIEMHLESLCDQTVPIHAGEFAAMFRKGETIHTENSHKYSLVELDDLLTGTGFALRRRWSDDDAAFASSVFVVE